MLIEYPNFIVIEYEIYQQKENAPLLYSYYENYNSGLGIPLIVFNKDKYSAGDRPILNSIESIIKKNSNSCPLINGSSEDFDDLNLEHLPGFPKIWTKDKILIKTGSGGDSELLKNLLKTENLSHALKEIESEKIDPLKIALSGKYIEFDNAVKIGNWIFQWNGPEIKISALLPEKETPPSLKEKEPLFQQTKPNLTLAKVLSLAAVDAVNPCALAVLSLMLITILSYNPTKKRNLLLAGLAFTASVFVMYLIYGLVIIKSFQLIQSLTSIRIWLYKILGAGAIILGCFKLRDFLRAGAVCKVSLKVNKIISKITSPKGAFLVGAFVTVFLLPCTIGPYVICGGILSGFCLLKSLPLLLLYNLIFVLPMIILVWVIYFGLSKVEDVSKWQAKHMKYLDLVSGLIILGLGIAMFLGLV